MSLKIYINEHQQAFKKRGNNDILAGVQISNTYSLIQISGAEYSGSSTSATSVKLVKVNRITLETISETTILNSVITYSGGQFLVDPDVFVYTMDECLYYLYFTNGENEYRSEIFLVQKFQQKLTADQTGWTADSSLITADNTLITI